ncbi:MAG: PilZ domain-containing protein [Anaerolineales bacterium]
MGEERRNLSRRDLSYYMRVLDESSGKTIGNLLDISTAGFRLEARHSIPLNKAIRLRFDQISGISRRSYMVITAIARWVERDQIDHSAYHVGFQVVDMTPSDYDVFVQMFNIYGSSKSTTSSNSTGYMYS